MDQWPVPSPVPNLSNYHEKFESGEIKDSFISLSALTTLNTVIFHFGKATLNTVIFHFGKAELGFPTKGPTSAYKLKP